METGFKVFYKKLVESFC